MATFFSFSHFLASPVGFWRLPWFFCPSAIAKTHFPHPLQFFVHWPLLVGFSNFKYCPKYSIFYIFKPFSTILKQRPLQCRVCRASQPTARSPDHVSRKEHPPQGTSPSKSKVNLPLPPTTFHFSSPPPLPLSLLASLPTTFSVFQVSVRMGRLLYTWNYMMCQFFVFQTSVVWNFIIYSFKKTLS